MGRKFGYSASRCNFCCNIWLEFDDLIDEICRTWPIYTNAYIMAQRWPKCHSNNFAIWSASRDR